jgi:hypothetical protein
MDNGVDFGWNWNEFDLMNIPVVAYGWIGGPWGVAGPSFSGQGFSATTTLYFAPYWGPIAVGSGFDLIDLTQGESGVAAANNGSWFQQGLNYLKNHPVFISVNEILAAQITVQWSTKTVCANLGAGASVPPTKAVTVGLYNNGNMSNWTNVLSSWGYSFGSNLIAGYQASTNSSGTIGGPTVSGPGLSGSYTYGGCMTVP